MAVIAIDLYEQLEEDDISAITLTSQQINRFVANRDITYILDLWGAYSRSGLDSIGFARVATGFSGLFDSRKLAEKCSEDDAIIIEAILLKLDSSSNSEKRAMSKIIKYYYVGVPDKHTGYPIPLKNMRVISELVGYGETKTKKLKESAENYVCGSLDALDRVLNCELYLTLNNR